MARKSTKTNKGFVVQKVRRRRDYVAEYARRIARAVAKGLSPTQARGHPKPGESAISASRRLRPLDDERLQRGLRILRQEKKLSVAARAIGVSPERLKHVAANAGAIKRDGRRWVLNSALPRRMLIYTRGQPLSIIVGDQAFASHVGRYMSAVGRFLETNDRALLGPFVGQFVTDISGKRHPFETNPNSLYRLTLAGSETFEQIYRIVV